ncbi:MAG: malonate decarboxylase holo-ACP synthase [Chitinophagaceae bacterium]
MELKPHYLVRVRGAVGLGTHRPIPPWVIASLEYAPFLVIRRAENEDGYVPVGVRGGNRGQRFAAWLSPGKAVEVITPYSLVDPVNWKSRVAESNPAIRTLHAVTPMMRDKGWDWGPTGSAGFELATGVSTLRDESDLDLVVDLPDKLSIRSARSLMKDLEKIALVQLDIQMNTPAGAVSMKEYTRSGDVLIKTRTGPLLKRAGSLWSC